MLDSELAGLYDVTTRRLNEQVRRNADRFPEDFAFQLTKQEVAHLMSQNATSSGFAVATAAGASCPTRPSDRRTD